MVFLQLLASFFYLMHSSQSNGEIQDEGLGKGLTLLLIWFRCNTWFMFWLHKEVPVSLYAYLKPDKRERFTALIYLYRSWVFLNVVYLMTDESKDDSILWFNFWFYWLYCDDIGFATFGIYPDKLWALNPIGPKS